MKLGVIRSLAGEHGVHKFCRTLGVVRSAYYAASKKAERPRARENVRLVGKARAIFEASGRTYGSPRVAVVLRRAGERCGRHRVARLMRQVGRRARQKRRFRPRTTDGRHLCPSAPNRLAERAEPPLCPGQVWQADITYVATKEVWSSEPGQDHLSLERLPADAPMRNPGEPLWSWLKDGRLVNFAPHDAHALDARITVELRSIQRSQRALRNLFHASQLPLPRTSLT